MDENEDAAKFEPLLACLFAWKYEADVIRLIKRGLDSGLGIAPLPHHRKTKTSNKRGNKTSSKGSKGKGRRGKRVANQDDDEDSSNDDNHEGEEDDEAQPIASKPFVALRLLSSIMEKDATREKLFKQFDLSVDIMSTFESYLTVIERRFDVSDEDEADEQLPDELLFRAMDCFTRFIIHAIGSENEQWRNKGDEVLGRLLAWSNSIIVPVLLNDLSGNDESHDDVQFAEAFHFVDKVPLSALSLLSRCSRSPSALTDLAYL